MIKKIAIIALSALLLGGCTMTNIFKPNEAVSDQKLDPVSSTLPQPSPTADAGLSAMPSTATSTDVTSLETDIGNTQILDEDFSDLN